MNVFSTNFVIGMILVVIIIVGSSVIFTKSMYVAKNPDVAICSQSATFAGLLRNPVTDKSLISLNCPVTQVKIRYSDVDQRVSKQKLTEIQYDNSLQYRLDYLMFKQVDECLQKVNYGVRPLFSRTFLPIDVKTYCVVCSGVSFDDATKQKVTRGSVGKFVRNQTTLANSRTIPQYLDEREDVAYSLESVYETSSNQVVIYWRTPTGSLYKIQDWISANFGQASRDLDVKVTNLLGFPASALTTMDVDGVMIMGEDKLSKISEICDITGNEKSLQGVS